MATNTKTRPADAPTYDQLEQENTDLNRRVSDLERRLTSLAVDQGRKERSIWETARRHAAQQVRNSFDAHWALALAEARNPLTGLIHRVRNLDARPKKAQLEGLLAAAEDAANALERGQAHTPRPTAQEALPAEPADGDIALPGGCTQPTLPGF
ncbi:hypothetical protein [Nocardiopsis tropica]|uniref:Uncharacterized protein n=1 Tax=Nocardiopsis tropica TaxID=109330 RepID=A0ABU7KZN7_9ACTN|nr:hypothetical protein [Nocardiopsis umidischolae]MEE2054773.1 hypothetical protein [Nocardiopsis umidischolae]